MRWNQPYMPLFTIGVKQLRAISFSPKQYGEPQLWVILRKLLAIYTFYNIRGLQIEVHGIDVTFTTFWVICMFFYSKKKENLFLSIINTDLNYKVLKIIKNIKCLFYLFEKTPNTFPFKIHLISIHNLLSDFIGVYLYRWMHTEQFRKLNSSCYWISVFFIRKIWYEIISELYLSD